MRPAMAGPCEMPRPQAKPASRCPGSRATRAKRRRIVNAARAGPFDLLLSAQRPAPKRHRRVALEVADHAVVLDNRARHNAERLAHVVPKTHQIGLAALDKFTRAAQVTEQHRGVDLARLKHLFDILLAHRDKDRLGKERRKHRGAMLKVVDLPQPRIRRPSIPRISDRF